MCDSVKQEKKKKIIIKKKREKKDMNKSRIRAKGGTAKEKQIELKEKKKRSRWEEDWRRRRSV